MFKPGDWVQAIDDVQEEDFPTPGVTWTHGKSGAVAHVLDVLDEHTLNVYFERTETTTVVDVSEVKFLTSNVVVIRDPRSLRS